jgi:hypothetical protein
MPIGVNRTVNAIRSGAAEPNRPAAVIPADPAGEPPSEWAVMQRGLLLEAGSRRRQRLRARSQPARTGAMGR